MLTRFALILLPFWAFSLTTLNSLYIVENCGQNGTYAEALCCSSSCTLNQKILQDYHGCEINKELLDVIREKIVVAYHNEGFPLVGVYFPEQDLSRGNLKACVAFACLGEVKGEGACWFNNEKLASEIQLQPGDPIVGPPLMNDLGWLNNNPFRSVSLVYEKGKSLNDTNIIVMTKDRFPLRIVSGYENTGNLIAGDSRYFAGFTWGNVFGLDHQFSYQFISANSANSWWGNVANYVAPLPWRHTFEVYGSYVQAKPDLTGPMQDKGKGWQLGGSYTVLLPSTTHYRNNIAVGYEFKRTNNFLEFDPDLIIQGYVDISQFVLSYEGTYEYDYGIIGFSLNAYLSPGHMTHFNRKSNFRAIRPGADDSYIYGTFIGESILRLAGSFSWAISAKGQVSGTRLLPTEELSVGGYLSVRGYDENEIISDQGLVLRNELRSPPLFFWRMMRKRGIKDQMQFLVFFDYGYAEGIDPNIFNKNSISIYSVGPGLRYRLSDYINVRFDYGFQLDKVSNRPFASGSRSRAHAGIIVSF